LPWQAIRRDAEQYALLFLAGPVGEAKLLGTTLRVHGGESDLLRCLRLCSDLADYGTWRARVTGESLPDVDHVEMANRLLIRATQILNNPRAWRAVTALATGQSQRRRRTDPVVSLGAVD
jgi:hypothetical protein